MRYRSSGNRLAGRLIAAQLCATLLFCAIPRANAAFSLAGDESVVGVTGQWPGCAAAARSSSCESLAAHVPKAGGSECQLVRLQDGTISGGAALGATTERAAPKSPPARVTTGREGVDLVAALTGTYPGHGAGSSSPTGAAASGASALIGEAYRKPLDLLVISWLRDVRQLNLPNSMPRTLLRPPQI